jgi:diadenosine tetraphosphate (Ap4A) HIT family hydrolase
MALILETNNFIVETDSQPHVTRIDGGHIRIVPKHKVIDRTELTPAQAIEMARLTMLVGHAMTIGLKNRGIDIGRINYQDNGNWGAHLHIHIYGRARGAKIQPFGHALNFPFRETGFYDNNEPLNEGDLEEIKKQIDLLSQTDKYREANWGKSYPLSLK